MSRGHRAGSAAPGRAGPAPTSRGRSAASISSPAQRPPRAGSGWMREAGMTARIDAAGNVVGRYEGERARAPALLLGSHIDTVRNAGSYDGKLGVLAAIEAVERAARARRARCRSPSRSSAFGDEEGVRFRSTLTGSRRRRRHLDPAALDAADADGVSDARGAAAIRLRPGAIGGVAPRPARRARLSSSCTSSRGRCSRPRACRSASSPRSTAQDALHGRGRRAMAGHAGTAPMTLRRDALAAAAEMVLAIERRAAATPTSSRRSAHRGRARGGQRHPGRVRFTIDIRSPSDAVRARRDRGAATGARADRRAPRRALRLERTYDGAAATCDAVRWSSSSRPRSSARRHPRRAPAERRRPRRRWRSSPSPDRHAVRPLRGRHQPQPAPRRSPPRTPTSRSARRRPRMRPPPIPNRPRRTAHDRQRRAITAFLDAAKAQELPRRAGQVPSDNPPGDCAPHAEPPPSCSRPGLHGRAPSGARRAGPRQRHGQRHQPGRPQPLRPRPDDRAQRPRRRRAAGRGLDQPTPTVPRSSTAGCTAAAPRSPRPISRPTPSRCSRLEAAGGAARRHGRAALHLRRGGRRRDRPGWLLEQGLTQARPRASRAGFSYEVVTAHNGCLHLEVEVHGKSAHAAMPVHRHRRAAGRDRASSPRSTPSASASRARVSEVARHRHARS